MGKQEFLARLREGLQGLPPEDIEERLTFYAEMIDDRMEEGLPEQAAVAEIGTVEDIVSQIVEETPFTRIVRESVRPKRPLQAWEILLLVLGFPLWFPLLLAAFAVVFSIYVVIWAVILSFWAVAVSLGLSALGAAALAIIQSIRLRFLQGIVLMGAACVLAGLAIFLCFGCLWATKGAVWLTKKIALGIKNLFLKKETIK